MSIQGRRIDLSEEVLVLEAGEYGKDEEGVWFMHVPAPGFGMGNLRAHEVVEHEDGTITVTPSILCTGHHGRQWHGYLTRGAWYEV